MVQSRFFSALLLFALSAAPWGARADEHADVQRMMQDRQYAQALKAIDDYLAKNPDDAKMRFRKGVVLSFQDKPGEALKVFQKLAEDRPEMPAPHNNIAVLLAARGEYERARASLEAAIRTNPAYSTAYQNLGDVYARLASQAYSRALQLDKSDSTTLNPKLALLRELTSEPVATTAVAANMTPSPEKTVQAPAASASAVPVTTASKQPMPAAPSSTAPATTASKQPLPATPSQTAPVKPATTIVAAASAPASTSAAPKPAQVAPSATAGAEVTQAVQAWADAWSRRDMNAYLAAYAPDFAGQAGSHKAWEADRRARIAPRKHIAVKLEDLSVIVSGDKATARFRQNYESDSLSVASRKTLTLAKDGSGNWRIQDESVGR